MTAIETGDLIEVIDRKYAAFPMRGEVLRLDEHPLGDSFALIRVNSSAQPAPEIWVNLRLARKVR